MEAAWGCLGCCCSATVAMGGSGACTAPPRNKTDDIMGEVQEKAMQTEQESLRKREEEARLKYQFRPVST